MKDMLGREELVTSAEAADRIAREFPVPGRSGTERVPLASGLGRVLPRTWRARKTFRRSIVPRSTDSRSRRRTPSARRTRCRPT